MYSSRPRHLRQSAYAVLNFLGRRHHKVRKLVDYYHYLGHKIDFALIRLHGVVALNIPYGTFGKGIISGKHFPYRPVKGSRRLFGVRNDGYHKMGYSVIHA